MTTETDLARLEGKVDILISFSEEDRADRRDITSRVTALETGAARRHGIAAAVGAFVGFFGANIKSFFA